MSLFSDIELLKQVLDDYLDELVGKYSDALLNYDAELIDYCNERISVLCPLSKRVDGYLQLLALEDNLSLVSEEK